MCQAELEALKVQKVGHHRRLCWGSTIGAGSIRWKGICTDSRQFECDSDRSIVNQILHFMFGCLTTIGVMSRYFHMECTMQIQIIAFWLWDGYELRLSSWDEVEIQ